MEYTKLGSTGLDISRLCLGCMTYGEPTAGAHPWTLDEEAARPILRHAVEKGINFFDTANSYSAGTSEVIVGKVLKELLPREELVIATKVFFPAGGVGSSTSPNRQGLSRKAIMTEIDASLRRLGTDYVDLYQIHRWDYKTPIEETMEALHDVVRSGKVRYIGASSMFAWQFAKAQEVARRNGWTTFVTMQNLVNLLYREEEREMLPLCQDQGVGVLPWSPLARGRLTRPADVQTERSRADDFGKLLVGSTASSDEAIIGVVQRIAERRRIPMAQVALAWVLAKPAVSAPIVGASKIGQLDDALAALKVELTTDELIALEEPYTARAVVGHN
ncbi:MULTISPECIES: aldo/keto reductase [unclassified Burkholderia]|uniref:aldo/keto reductase n=1 Tax=unclassified Burkholderia TaxID=2613784 RepID=UPI000F55F752|nr:MULTISPECIES: aldo/keto reductase [unclassified Burkholderia]RQS26842.1 aldo/keto reductase [Burkholderia sp. Bp8995]RQS51728.1 aldo/keto reductase [Burkholderia sp. Bp8989]